MSFILPVGAFAPFPGGAGSARAPVNPFTEAQVEGALSILEQEAGLSEETMSTLRLAVESGMSRRRAQHDTVSVQQQAVGGGAYPPMFSLFTSQQMSPQQQFVGANMSFMLPDGTVHTVDGATAMQAPAITPHALAQVVMPAASAGPVLPPPGVVGGVAGMPAPRGFDGKANPFSSMMAPRRVKPASSKRQQLTVEEAAEIYSLRPRRGERSGGMMHCRTLAPKFGVTPKTIRDVWSGRTWAEATRHLWTPEEISQRKRMRSERPSAKTESQSSDDGDDADLVAPGQDGAGHECKRAKQEPASLPAAAKGPKTGARPVPPAAPASLTGSGAAATGKAAVEDGSSLKSGAEAEDTGAHEGTGGGGENGGGGEKGGHGGGKGDGVG